MAPESFSNQHIYDQLTIQLHEIENVGYDNNCFYSIFFLNAHIILQVLQGTVIFPEIRANDGRLQNGEK